jgi:hypothetical protein
VAGPRQRPEDEEVSAEPDDVLDLGVVGQAETSLDDGSPDADAVPTVPPSVSRRLLLATGALGLAGVAGVEAWRRSGARPWTSPARPPAVQATALPAPLPGAAPGWHVFALGGDVLLRIHPATGRVTRTTLPAISEGQVSLVPVRRAVLIRPLGEGPGYVVPDGGPAAEMPPGLAGAGSVLPGPDLDHVWTQVPRGRTTLMMLTALDGTHTRVAVPVPEFATTGPMTDGAGGVLLEGVGGLYHVSPSGQMQVSNAILLAVGPGGLLTLERDTRGRWRTLVRASNARARDLPVPIGPQLPHGVLAPDHRRVVLYVLREPVSVGLAVVDIGAGVPMSRRVRNLDTSVAPGEGTVVWTPDSGRVLSLDALGRLMLIGPTTGQVSALAPALPGVRQLAIRTAA